MKGRLTAGRLLSGLAGSLVFFTASLIIGLTVGFTTTGGGRHLVILDLPAILHGTATPGERQIFLLARLPRAIAGAVAGMGLAGAGVAFQAVLRNPLAEPYTLGVSSGAALGAVLAIHLGLEAIGPGVVPICAFAGALAAVVVVWRLARVGSSRPAATLLLAGVTLAFLCSAATMLVQTTAAFGESNRILRWLMGGLDGVASADLGRSALVVLLGASVLLYLARDLNALAAGGDAAASVGVSVDRTIAVAYVAASLTVGAVVAFAGPIGFVGILVPHGLRAIVGPDHRVLLPASILCGGGFVVLSDTVGRLILSPHELPVGIITALSGGAFFLGLLLREKTRSRLWGG